MEKVLNIFLIIRNNSIVEFKAAVHEMDGSDNEIIESLKEKITTDLENAKSFRAPKTTFGNYMSYRKFHRLSRQNKEIFFFEEIFQNFDVPDQPLILVTPVVDGKVISS